MMISYFFSSLLTDASVIVAIFLILESDSSHANGLKVTSTPAHKRRPVRVMPVPHLSILRNLFPVFGLVVFSNKSNYGFFGINFFLWRNRKN